jgi:hypothetical protein
MQDVMEARSTGTMCATVATLPTLKKSYRYTGRHSLIYLFIILDPHGFLPSSMQFKTKTSKFLEKYTTNFQYFLGSYGAQDEITTKTSWKQDLAPGV